MKGLACVPGTVSGIHSSGEDELAEGSMGDDSGLTCQSGCFGGLDSDEDQPVQNFNQPKLEEVRGSDKGATSGSPMVGAGREVGRRSLSDSQVKRSGFGLSLRLQRIGL